jgi:hypothetical protein
MIDHIGLTGAREDGWIRNTVRSSSHLKISPHLNEIITFTFTPPSTGESKGEEWGRPAILPFATAGRDASFIN